MTAGGIALHVIKERGLLVFGSLSIPLQPSPQITEECVVTTWINWIHIAAPHLLVTLGEVALLIVLPGDIADSLYAQ